MTVHRPAQTHGPGTANDAHDADADHVPEVAAPPEKPHKKMIIYVVQTKVDGKWETVHTTPDKIVATNKLKLELGGQDSEEVRLYQYDENACSPSKDAKGLFSKVLRTSQTTAAIPPLVCEEANQPGDEGDIINETTNGQTILERASIKGGLKKEAAEPRHRRRQKRPHKDNPPHTNFIKTFNIRDKVIVFVSLVILGYLFTALPLIVAMASLLTFLILSIYIEIYGPPSDGSGIDIRHKARSLSIIAFLSYLPIAYMVGERDGGNNQSCYVSNEAARAFIDNIAIQGIVPYDLVRSNAFAYVSREHKNGDYKLPCYSCYRVSGIYIGSTYNRTVCGRVNDHYGIDAFDNFIK